MLLFAVICRQQLKLDNIIIIIIIRQFIRRRNMSVKSLQGRRTGHDTSNYMQATANILVGGRLRAVVLRKVREMRGSSGVPHV